jgi:hypothetical protein
MLLTSAGIPINHTMPKKSASARLTRKSKASLASPITPPILAAGTTVILLMAICETSRSPSRIEFEQPYISSRLQQQGGPARRDRRPPGMAAKF